MSYLKKKQKISDLAEFLHGCCCAPVPSTFTRAIQNNQFVTWPGLTAQLINKHLPPSRATAKSHMHQEAQGLQSTKLPTKDNYMKNIKRNIARLRGTMPKGTTIKTVLEKDIENDAFLSSLNPNKKTNNVCYFLIENSPKGMGYLDLTERFPYKSR